MQKTILLGILIFLTFSLNAQDTYFPKLAWGSSIAADFNNDNKKDLFYCGRDSESNGIARLYINDGTKLNAVPTEIEGLYFSSIAAIDFNTDGFVDLIISGKNTAGEIKTVLYKNNAGTFSVVSTDIVPVFHGTIHVQDFDNDNDPDILITGRSDDKNIAKIYKNNGNFIFSEQETTLTPVYNSAVIWDDLNNDGLPDIVISGEDGLNRFSKIYKCIEDFSYTEMPASLLPLSNGDAQAFDIDNDGDLDIALSGLDIYGSEQTKIYINNSNFSFQESTIVKSMQIPKTAYGNILFKDVNNDKKADLIITGKGDLSSVDVFQNNGNMNFKKVSLGLDAIYHSTFLIEDFDNDNSYEIFVSGINKQNQFVTQLYGLKDKIEEAIVKKEEEKFIQPSFTLSSGKPGELINFSNKTTTNYTGELSYKWDFGDGTVSDLASPNHTYETAGNYQVSLYVSGGGISSEYKKKVNIFEPIDNSVTLSEKEQLVLNTEAITWLKKYESLTNELGEINGIDEEKTQKVKEQLIELFLNRKIFVFNDLDPTGKTSALKEIETYVSDIILLYPDGIFINLDFSTTRMSKVLQHNKMLYSFDVIVDKRINGNYNNITQNNSQHRLVFRIAFNKKNSKISNLKLVGVRNFEGEQTQMGEKEMEELNKAELSDMQKEQIKSESVSVISDYARNLALISSTKEEEEDKIYYEQAFIELFKDSLSVLHNDISSDLKINNYKPKEYIETFRKLYPKGIINLALNLDSAEFKPVLKQDNQFYRYVYIDKNFSGLEKGNQKYSFSENIVFKLVFDQQENTFGNFRIESVEQSESDFFQATINADTTSFSLAQLSREGLGYGISMGGGYGTIMDNNKIQETLNNQNIWTITPEYSYKGGVMANYFISDKIGFYGGFLVSNIQTSYTLSGTFDDGEILTADTNGDSFIKKIDATGFKYKVQFTTLDIPLGVCWLSSKPNKFGFYASMGGSVSVSLYNNINETGQYEYLGYYPGFDESMQQVPVEKLDFYTRTVESFDSALETAPASFSLNVSVGGVIPIGYFSELKIGPEINWGMTDISNIGVYNDIFKEETSNKGIYIRNYGINISLIFK